MRDADERSTNRHSLDYLYIYTSDSLCVQEKLTTLTINILRTIQFLNILAFSFNDGHNISTSQSYS